MLWAEREEAGGEGEVSRMRGGGGAGGAGRGGKWWC